jgi:hypothetical protein
MLEHLSQEMNHLVRRYPLLVQGRQQMPAFADCRERRDFSPLPRDLGLGGLAPRGPGFAQERRQRNVGLVLKVQDCSVFPHRVANRGQLVLDPFLSRRLVRLEILTFWFIDSQGPFRQIPCGVRSDDGVARRW